MSSIYIPTLWARGAKASVVLWLGIEAMRLQVESRAIL